MSDADVSDLIWYHQSISDKMRERGWHIELHYDDLGRCSIELFDVTKHGEVRKHPAITFGFEPLSYKALAMPDGGVMNVDFKPRRRPWSVSGKRAAATGTWSSFDKARIAFEETIEATL